MSMKATKFSNRNAIFWYFSVPLITRLVIFSVALVWSKYGFYFYNRTLMSRFLEKQADYQPRLQELLRGVRGHAPREKSWKIELSETPYPAYPGSNATNLYVYLLNFSQSFVINDSRADVQRFMIPKFLKQRFMILTCFVSMISPRPLHWTRLVSLCTKFPLRLSWADENMANK